jgi:hypothetical protein
MVDKMVMTSEIYNTIVENTGKDITKIILGYTEKLLKDYGEDENKENVYSTILSNGCNRYYSWDHFLKSMETVKKYPFNFYLEKDSDFHLQFGHFKCVNPDVAQNQPKKKSNFVDTLVTILFLWSKHSNSLGPCCFTIQIVDYDAAVQESIINFLIDRDSFTPELHFTFEKVKSKPLHF